MTDVPSGEPFTLAGQDVVVLSSIDWDFLWQGPQEIASRLSAQGSRVVFVENLGVRTPRLGDAKRIVTRLINWVRSLLFRGSRAISDSIVVISPIVFPPFGSWCNRWLNRTVFVPLLGRSIRRQLTGSDLVLWTFLPTDVCLMLMDALSSTGGRSVSVYYAVDNFELVADDAERLRESERTLSSRADVLLAAHPELARRLESADRTVELMPYGVNLRTFTVDARMADRLAELQRPVVGYIGGIHRHVDLALIRDLARMRPDWSWVLIGPQQSSVESLDGLTNVHLMGQVPHEELASYVKGFDVGIVPYADNPYTQTVVPTKINEYLAMEKPVVSTALPAVVDFNEQHQVLEVARPHPAEFMVALERAIGDTDAARRQHRRAVAEASSWDARMATISELIREAVGG